MAASDHPSACAPLDPCEPLGLAAVEPELVETGPDPAEPDCPQSRRRILAAGIAGAAGLVLGGYARPGAANAAAGSALIIGRTTNNSGSSSTTLTSTGSGSALRAQQNGTGTALVGVTASATGYGVQGQSTGSASTGGGVRAAGGNNHGVVATTANKARYAVSANNTAATTGTGAAILARGGKNSGVIATTASGAVHAIHASNTGAYTGGMGGPIAVWGEAADAHGYGVNGQAPSGVGVSGVSDSGTGIEGLSGSGYGVYAQSNSGPALYCDGDAVVASNLTVTGNVHKAGGTFKIDHPADPSRKYLQHSFVESPDMKNVYDGVATLDAHGEGSVELPGYFDALNRDPRVQLTPVGRSSALFVKAPVEGGRFTIAGGSSGQHVYWQVTGIRRDPWANANPVVAELPKKGREVGTCLHPELYGEPASKGVVALARAKARPAAKP